MHSCTPVEKRFPNLFFFNFPPKNKFLIVPNEIEINFDVAGQQFSNEHWNDRS